MEEPKRPDHSSPQSKIESGAKQSRALSEARAFFTTENLEHLTPAQIVQGLEDINSLEREAKLRFVEQIAKRAALFMQNELKINATDVKRRPGHSTAYDVSTDRVSEFDNRGNIESRRIARQVEEELVKEFPKVKVFGSDRNEVKINIDWY